jgi:hypothetical protein
MAVLTERGRALLCGVPGTGKSMLLQDLYATLRDQGRSVALLPYGDTVAEMADAEILLVDEADRLSLEQIRQLLLRSGAVVLAGLPGLRERAAEAVGAVGSVTLEKLSQEDVARLVSTRLAAVGRVGTLFAPDAVAALARHSGGLFRVVIILAGAALFFAELRGADIVASSDIAEAAAMRNAIADEATDTAPVAEPPPTPAADAARWPRRALVALVAIIAAVGVTAHLAATAGGMAAAVETAAAPAVPVKAPMSPKHKLQL